MFELNQNILIYLNSFLKYQTIEKTTLLFSDLPIFFIPIFLISLWIYYTYKDKNINKKNDLLFIFYACVIAIFINLIIKHFFHFDRPETVLEGVGKLILKHIPDASFPSDHSSVSFAFASSLVFASYKKTGIIFMIIALIMCFSRVILGVHWPYDIIVGIFVGIISAIISFKLLKNNKYIEKFNSFILKIANKIKL